MDKEFAKQEHKSWNLTLVLAIAVVVGIGLVSMSDMSKLNYPYDITGNVVKQVGKAPTTVEGLSICKILYEDHFNYCSVSFDVESDMKADCFAEAKSDCFSCVLNTKNPTDSHLREYCYK